MSEERKGILLRLPSKLAVLMIIALINLVLAWITVGRESSTQYTLISITLVLIGVLWELGEYIKKLKTT